MRTVALTGTTLSTSRLGFGLSGLHHAARSRARQRLLSQAFDFGIRYFDTAPFYGHELAENELGRFASGRRELMLIATKFGLEPDPLLNKRWLMYSRMTTNWVLRSITGRSPFAIKPARDYSAKHAAMSLERSLRALRTDYVDILYLHEPTISLLTDVDRLIGTLQRLRQAGKVKYVGLSGAAQPVIAIASAYPALAQVMQIDASAGGAELQSMQASRLPLHASFGHFRGKSTPIAVSLAAAIDANRDGVLLFSTRRCERIASMVKLLERSEAR
jgi:aryl-alcohol dehydrogenase-like predicted oxidoreductase